MNKYHDSKIFKIICLKTNQTYYGATTMRLSNAIAIYQSYYRSYLRGKYNYISLFEILKNQCYTIRILERFSCENREELNQRLKKYLDANQCVNKNRFLTKEEKKQYHINYYKLNKEHYKQYQRQYYKLNREKILNKLNNREKNIIEYI